MTIARASPSPNEAAGNAIRWSNRGLEFLWLLTLIAVPLAFIDRDYVSSELKLAYVDLPKTTVLRTLVGLMAALWLFEWGLQGRLPFGSFAIRSHLRPGTWPGSLKSWLGDQPTRWLTLVVVLYLGTTLLGTALSVSFSLSMWGLVPGQDTYPAYTIVSYVVLFGVIATHLKTRSQLGRLMAAIVLMGLLVGGYSISQHYGHDVFSVNEGPGISRTGSTMGNSILAGSVLLMTISISLMAASITLRKQVRSWRFWGEAGLWTMVMSVQLLGIIFTSARGPWIGTVSALVGFLGLLAVFLGWRTLGRAALVLVLAAGLTALIVIGPPRIAATTAAPQPGAAETLEGGGLIPTLALIPTFPESALPEVMGRLTSVGSQVGGGGLAGRIEIWKASQRLILYRPWFEFDKLSLSSLRPLIGYGPDLFKYTYLLERRPRGTGLTLVSERFAHNFFIHKTVELGLLGLATSGGLFAVPLMVGGYQLLRGRGDFSALQKLVLAGLLAALAGRFLEQMVGVAAVSDLTITWALLAAFAALPSVMRAPQASPEPARPIRQARRSGRSSQTWMGSPHDRQLIWRLAIVVCLVAGITVLTLEKTIKYPLAAVMAQQGLEHINEENYPEALRRLARANELAPDVFVYHHIRASVYSAYRGGNHLPREPECDSQPATRPYQECLARKAYLAHRDGLKQRPFDWRSRLAVARSSLDLATLQRDSDLAGEATKLFHEVAELDPQGWGSWERQALVHLQLGQPESALLPLENSLALLGDRERAAYPRLLQGMAFLSLDQPRKAVETFDEAIRLFPDYADAFANRGVAHNKLGQYQRALQDFDEAIKLNRGLAMAYSNRGNAYSNLDQLEKAIANYNKAIRLDPRIAIAYYNRALAYTYLDKE